MGAIWEKGLILEQPVPSTMTAKREVATLGGGCFWCLEAVYEQLDGVAKVVSGYAGGHVQTPTYEQVCDGTTGHAEVVQVTFDPGVTSYREILEVFFTIHDPTTLNRQGNDVGEQYRSAVFWHSDEQRRVAESLIEELEKEDIYEGRMIVTEVVPAQTFYPAEEHHQGYYRRNPTQGYCRAVVAPKLQKFRQKWAKKLRAPA